MSPEDRIRALWAAAAQMAKAKAISRTERACHKASRDAYATALQILTEPVPDEEPPSLGDPDFLELIAGRFYAGRPHLRPSPHDVPIAWTIRGGYGWANCITCPWRGPRRSNREEAENDAAEHQKDTT